MTKRCKTSLLAILLALSFTVAGKAQSSAPVEKPDTKDNKNVTADKAEDKAVDKNVEKQDVRLLQVGHIVKVDQKKRTITIEDPQETSDQSQPRGQFGRGAGRIGRRGSFGRVNGTRANAQPDWPQNLQTRIWITDATLIKEDGKTIPWKSLRKGDVIQVSGTAKKKDLEAKEIDIVQHVGE